MLKGFKAFALKGNVIELAVAVVLGVAFNAVVQSFANDVLMGLVAAVFGEPDFSAIVWTVNGTQIGIGTFLTALVNFLIVAFALFIVVRAIAKAQYPAGRPPEAPSKRPCPHCFLEVPLQATRCAYCTSDLMVEAG